MTKRPLGITLIAIWYLIGGIFFLFLLFTGTSPYVFQVGTTLLQSSLPVIVAVNGVVDIIIFIGLIKGFTWAWCMTMIYAVALITFSILEQNFFRPVLEVIIIVYLMQPHVRTYFKIYEK